MNCPNCNHPVREGAAFCVKCGYRLPQKPQVKICPACGRKQKADSFFCIECGHSFGQEEAAAPGPSGQEQTVSYQEPGGYQEAGSYQEPGGYQEAGSYREPGGYRDPGSYGPHDDYGWDKDEKKNRFPVIPAVLAVLCLVGAAVLAFFLFIKPTPNPKPPVEKTEEVATEKADDTESTEATEDTSEPADDWADDATETLDLPGLGSSTKTYPTDPSDFLEYSDPNGMYSFVYPRDFFQTCTYNADDSMYELITADGRQTYRIYDEPAAVANNPGASARRKMEEAKSQFDLNSPQMYTFTSKEISDTGYFRTIITGPDRYEDKLGHYYIFSCTSNRTYILSYDYNYDVGDAEEYSLNGYLTDCLYRGWSISGSSYRLRNYDLFKKDDMGTKK